MGSTRELNLIESPADRAARVRALLKQCCRMCVPGHEHACERRTSVPFEIHGARVGEQMAEMFAVDRADCEAFSVHEWYARSPFRRVLMRLVALADPLM